MFIILPSTSRHELRAGEVEKYGGQGEMNKQVIEKTYFKSAVVRAEIVAGENGICNLAGILGAAVEGVENAHLFVQGAKFYETELSKNLDFAKQLFDLTMNCLDINEDVANRHIRIAQVEKMVVALNELRRKL